MATFLHRLRERLYLVEATSVRVQQMQDEIGNLNRSVAKMRSEAQTSQEQFAGLLSQAAAVLENIQQLSGGTLSSTNSFRSDGFHVLGLCRLALGRIEERQLRFAACSDWRQNEFRVFSQFGEDGLIQFLVRETGAGEKPFFVEFGVEDYAEANTRFLLLNNRWSGLVIDGSLENIATVKESEAWRRHELRAEAAFITRENIDSLLEKNGVPREIGLLSIDIDGNDYWVWEAITRVNPILVVIEYNYRFGPDTSLVVPYDPEFVKEKAHASAIYYGASLRAICNLAARKGYAFVGCSSGGVNAFFVRRDHLTNNVREVMVEEGFVYGQHEEMRTETEGTVIKAGFEAQHALLLQLPLIRIEELETK